MMENVKKVINGATITMFIVAFLLGYGVSSRLVNHTAPQTADVTAGITASKTAEHTDFASSPSLADISGAPIIAQNQGAVSGTMISVDDQAAGFSVAVAIKSSKRAWVVVHEETDGKPGKILGAQLFSEGSHTGVVDLLRPTEAGKKYSVMLHEDDGDHAFDYQKDLPIKDADGNVINRTFSATETKAR